METTVIQDLIDLVEGAPGWVQVGAGALAALWLISKITPTPEDDDELKDIVKALIAKDSVSQDQREVEKLRAQIEALNQRIEQMARERENHHA